MDLDALPAQIVLAVTLGERRATRKYGSLLLVLLERGLPILDNGNMAMLLAEIRSMSIHSSACTGAQHDMLFSVPQPQLLVSWFPASIPSNAINLPNVLWNGQDQYFSTYAQRHGDRPSSVGLMRY